MATRRIREFLDGNHARYVMIHHSPAYTAQELAHSMHLPGKFLAKTVVVKLDERVALAVVPANKDVDLDQLRHETGARQAQIAEPADFVDRFTDCQLGTVPPFGNLFGVDAYVDRDIAKMDQVAFTAGTHSDAIAMTFADYRRLAHPRLMKIAAEQVGTAPVFCRP